MIEKSEYCEICHESGTDDDCQTCEYRMPELMPVNIKAYTIWSKCYTQLKYAAFGSGMGAVVSIPTGLDYNAVKLVADLLDIELSPGDFLKIQVLEKMEIKHRGEILKSGSN